MSYLLYISVSPQGERSSSREVGAAFLAAYKAANPDDKIVERDLDANKIPHLDGEALMAGYVPAEARTPDQAKKHGLRMELAEEIMGAKSIVISTPMWNWSIPSVLKAYLDQIIIVGVLDPYGNKKLADKKVTLLIASGSAYSAGSWHPEWDHESTYIKFILGQIGATDIELVRAEYCLAGVAPGMEGLIDKRAESMAEAKVAAAARAASI
jgi:FMN-dependent NADH-azoreductase